MVAITSAAIAIYFGEWIKSVIPDKPYHAVATGACDLYWNSMLCERLAGRTGILLRVGRTAKFLKLSDLCIKIKFIRLDITLLVLL